jgi:hypothetical protein
MNTRLEWIFRLRQDVRESWDYVISDDSPRIMQIPKGVVKDQLRVNHLNEWLNGNLWFELFFRLRHDGHYSDYVCLIERELDRAVDRRVPREERIGVTRNIDGPMFINPSELTDDPQGIRPRVGPPVKVAISLKPLYLLNGLRFEMPSASLKVQIIFVLENGEIDATQNSRVISRLQGQLVSSMVKRSSQISNYVSNSEAPFLARGFRDFSPKELTGIINIQFANNGLALWVDDIPNFFIEQMKILCAHSALKMALSSGFMSYIILYILQSRDNYLCR